MTTLSVLICTFNRHEILQVALTALIINTDEKPDQIIIVNGGDDKADEVVEKFIKTSSINIELIKTKNVNLATSRNIGLAHCKCKIVAMTDDDAEVYPNWVTQMKKIHAAHPEAGGVGGVVLGSDSEHSLLSRIADIATFPSPSEPAYVRNLPGVNVSYKREVLEQIGPQDVTLFRGEDVDFNWRVKRLGYEIYYNPQIKVIHHHRPNLKGYLHQTYMYGRAYFLVRRKWPDMYCVYPHNVKKIRDILKWGYFFISILFLPLLEVRKLNSISDRFFSLPILVLNQIYWKVGMFNQFLKSKM